MKKRAFAFMIGASLAMSALVGCGSSKAESSAGTAVSSQPAETENETTETSAKLSASQQKLADRVFEQLQNKEYDALFADMIYPENSVVKVDDLNNFFIMNLTMDEVENGTPKEKINERYEDGMIKFDYGLEAGGYSTIYILENADTPDGYEVRIAGLSGSLFTGEKSDTAQETVLILPSGLTNVVVDGVKLDDYKDETYFADADPAELRFDPADYTAYKVVFPCMNYQDYLSDDVVQVMEDEYGFTVGRHTFEITADSAYGTLKGKVEKDCYHCVGGRYEDREGVLYQPMDSTAANERLLVLLQQIYDRASSGVYDADSYREFFAEGTDDAVIAELTDTMDKFFNEGTGTITNLQCLEVHTYTDVLPHQYDVPVIQYVGSGKMDMDIGVHSSYDQIMTYTEDHRDAYKELHLTVQTDGETVKIVSFAENSHLNNLFNWMGSSFEN